MPRPRWMIPAYEPKGHKSQVALPPDPHTDAALCVGLRDWIERKDLWNERRLIQIPGTGGDSTYMMRNSFRENIGCTSLQGDCYGCKNYHPTKCVLPIDNPQAICPLDSPTYRHDMGDCVKCENYNPTGYVCLKWMEKGPDWRRLWGKEKGKTALVLAPGPHLLDHEDEIKKLSEDRDNYFTLAISRAINAFQPNYYLTIERRKPAYWDSEKMKFPQTTLIAGANADWRMCKAFRNRFFGETFNTASELGTMLDSGKERLTIVMGNCSADALLVAYRLGAKKINVYGYEFSCSMIPSGDPDKEDTVDNYYHDMKITDPHLRLWGVSTVKYFPAKGIDGELCATSYHLVTVAAYCEGVAEMIENHGVEVENRTQKGQWWFKQKSEEEKVLEARVAELEAELEVLRTS